MNLLKIICTAFFVFAMLFLSAQDSINIVESRESAYESRDVILLALAGFAVLVAGYFLFRRSKQRRGRY